MRTGPFLHHERRHRPPHRCAARSGTQRNRDVHLRPLIGRRVRFLACLSRRLGPREIRSGNINAFDQPYPLLVEG